MKNAQLLFSLLLSALLLLGCKKTYEENPPISLRTKMSRITGKWKLVSMTGIDRKSPHLDQYMELTKNDKGPVGGNSKEHLYEAKFYNFQEQYWSYADSSGDYTYGDSLWTNTGIWNFFEGKFTVGSDVCYYNQELERREGLKLHIYNSPYLNSGMTWKILRLTNKSLKLQNGTCNQNGFRDFYEKSRILEFEKE